MESLIEMRLGPIHVASAAIVVGLIAADALWTIRLHRHALSQAPGRPRGYTIGLALGVWSRSLLVAIAGIATLFGSGIAFVLFAAGVIWRALGPGRAFVQGFLAGFEESTGSSRRALASAFGALWVGVSRGIPLALLFSFMRAA